MRFEIRLTTEALTFEAFRTVHPWAFEPGYHDVRGHARTPEELFAVYGPARDALAAASDAPARAEALRLAIGTLPRERVEIREVDARVVHGSDPRGWALWSDGVLTNAWELSAETLAGLPRSLSADAVSLIDDVWGADSGDPRVGWATLAAVARIVGTEIVDEPEQVPEHLDSEAYRLRVVMTDGTARDLYTWHLAFEAEQIYEVCGTYDELVAAIVEHLDELGAEGL